MRNEMMATAVGRLTATMHQAADKLASLLHSESDAIRLSAARAILI